MGPVGGSAHESSPESARGELPHVENIADDHTQEMPLPPLADNPQGAGSGATAFGADSLQRLAGESASDSGIDTTGGPAPDWNSTAQLPLRPPVPRPATAVLPTVADSYPRHGPLTDAPRLDPVDVLERPTPAAPAEPPAPVTYVRLGAGFPGFLSVAALAGIGVGMFALPLAGKRSTDYFHTLRSAATRVTIGSSSEAGRSVATFWWRYGALVGFGVLALLVALCVATTRLRRTIAALLLLATLAFGGVLAVAGYQTQDPDKQRLGAKFARVRIAHLQLGFWIAAGSCVVLALAALLAASRRRRA